MMDHIRATVGRIERSLARQDKTDRQLLAEMDERLEGLRVLMERMLSKEAKMSVEFDQVRAEVEAIRNGIGGIQTSVTALAVRLASDPTAAEVAAVADELSVLADTLPGISASVDSLDPDVPTGAITEPSEDSPPQ
ncbi:MAG TPA: hypothetical protein VJM51_01390 [Dehalococcoidia bacterium]|nr:hypothetical protein [Dehalococcoidia bacterium]